MDYDPSKYCDLHCPGRDSWLGPDQPCRGTGHAPSSRCETCKRLDMARRDRKEREVFIAIDARRNDAEFMGRLRRHVEENRTVLDRLRDG